ncbi:MAG: diacylglycerol/polyprenol kinase family protein [Planctomycetota bacterium]
MAEQTRKTVSWPRKLFHLGMISSVGLVTGLSGIERPWALAVMAVLAVIVGGLDLLRLLSPAWNARVLREFSSIIRREETDHLSSSTWFLIGALATLAFAPLPFAATAFLYLAVGDPIASWIGVRFGRTRLPGGKSLEGSLALVVACALLGTVFLGLTHSASWTTAPLLALAGAFAAAFAEWLPLGPVDDNCSVPLATAGALAGVTSWLHPVLV